MKGPCPRCPSSDAFHTYNYGKHNEHGHCFSCGFHKNSDTIDRLESQVERLDAEARKHISDVLSSPPVVELPWETKDYIDVKALTWLKKYGIMDKELKNNNVMWCNSRHWLVFPIRNWDRKSEYKDAPLLGYTARAFPFLGETRVEKKWISKGPLGTTNHFIGESKEKSTFVLVEDIVSAIKVGRQERAMPLFGSHLSANKLTWLHTRTDNVVIWLDSDKWKEALTFAKSCQLVGLNTKVVYTDKDPKSCTDKEIFEHIAF